MTENASRGNITYAICSFTCASAFLLAWKGRGHDYNHIASLIDFIFRLKYMQRVVRALDGTKMRHVEFCRLHLVTESSHSLLGSQKAEIWSTFPSYTCSSWLDTSWLSTWSAMLDLSQTDKELW